MHITTFVAITCLAAGAMTTTSNAQAAIRKETNLPAQGLETALQSFADERELQIIFRSTLVRPFRTHGVVGELTVEEALSQLLNGTGLTYRYLDEKTITILPVPSAPASTASPQNTTTGAVGRPEAVSNDERSLSLEEVVVTAQKKAERLQDVPISIGVLSGQDLDRSSSRSVADVLNEMGGISLIEREPGYTQIAVRGVVPDQSLGTSAAGYYLDELPFAFITKSQLPDASAFDLARIEVLRGPQGTLYGANALSGVVRVLTNDADLDAFELKGRARGSDTEQGSGNFGGDLAVNVPLIPGELAVRAVASYSDLSGFIDTPTHERFNDTRAGSYRLKFGYQPTERLNIVLGLMHSRLDNGGPSYAFDDLTTPFSDDQADQRIYDAFNLIAQYRWSSVSLLSSTAYVDYDSDTQTEIEAFPGFFLNFFNGNDLRSFSQELRFSSALAGAWQWSAGAIYKSTTEKLTQRAPAFFAFPLIEDQHSDSYAVFGEVTRAFDDGRFELTAGLRYYDEHAVSTEISSFSGAPTTPRRPVNFDKVTGRLVLNYKPQPSRTFYGSIATGFRAGLNQNAAVAGSDPSFGAIDPDTLVNYEIGAKGAFLDGRLTLDTALYYTDWRDIQQSLITAFGFVAGFNAGSARGLGVDGAITFQPTRALTLQTSVGWSGLKLEDDVHHVVGGTDFVLFQGGERVNLSPEWTGSIGGSYRLPVSIDGGDVVLSSSYAYRSSVTLRYLAAGILTPTSSAVTRTLKAALGLRMERWSIELFGDNLTDERDAIMPRDLTFASTSIRQRPRTIGLQATFQY